MSSSVPEDAIATAVVDAAIEVHRTLGGPGLLESVYEEALVFEIETRGLHVERQRQVPLTSKGRTLANNLRLDLLVQDRVIVEGKASSTHNPLFEVQALTYLRLMNLRLALVVNFGLPLAKDGIHRVVNRLDEDIARYERQDARTPSHRRDQSLFATRPRSTPPRSSWRLCVLAFISLTRDARNGPRFGIARTSHPVREPTAQGAPLEA